MNDVCTYVSCYNMFSYIYTFHAIFWSDRHYPYIVPLHIFQNAFNSYNKDMSWFQFIMNSNFSSWENHASSTSIWKNINKTLSSGYDNPSNLEITTFPLFFFNHIFLSHIFARIFWPSWIKTSWEISSVVAMLLLLNILFFCVQFPLTEIGWAQKWLSLELNKNHKTI